jgi:hypothetical protein
VKRAAYFIPVPSSLIREWDQRAVHNIPYNGPTVQKATTVAMFHVKSPLNAGGGSDIVTSLEGGVLGAKRRAAEVPYFKYSHAMTPFVKGTYRTNM